MALNIIWQRQFGTNSGDGVSGIAKDNLNNTYISGNTSGRFPGNTLFGKNDGFITKYNDQGTLIWQKQFGTSADDYTSGITTDSAGNIYICGSTGGTLAGNTSFGGQDAYVAKYNAQGTLLWQKQFGGKFVDNYKKTDAANSIATDIYGNVYITGYTDASLPGNFSSGNTDAFIVKYNSQGSLLWQKQFSLDSYHYDYNYPDYNLENYPDYGIDITTDNASNIYLINLNHTYQSYSDSDFEISNLAKYNAQGDLLWKKEFNVTELAYSGYNQVPYNYNIVTDGQNSIYVTAYQYNELSEETAETDIILGKYDLEGNLIWYKQFGTNNSDGANDITLDNLGYIYLAGSTKGSWPGNTLYGKADSFVTKYTPRGNLIWQKQFGTGEDDFSGGIVTNNSGKILVAGTTSGTLPGNTSSGDRDGYLVNLSESGNYILSLLNDHRVKEGDSGTTQANFYVSLVNPSTNPITVTYSTSNGTAIAGKDYIALEGILTFKPQETIKTIKVSVKSDWLQEPDETILVNLGTATGAAILSSEKTGTLTISDDDARLNWQIKTNWQKQPATSEDIFAEDITTDNLGNIYLSGYNGSSFLGKYNTEGTLLWKATFSSGYDYNCNTGTDSLNNVYVFGNSHFLSYPGSTYEPGDSIPYISKYNTQGTLLWQKKFDQWLSDKTFRSPNIDSVGNLYLIGYTNLSLPGNTSAGALDALVSKYSPEGNLLWQKQFGSNKDDSAATMVTDQLGNIYVSGNTKGSLPGNTSAGLDDVLVAKYSSQGTLLWQKQFGSTNTDSVSDIATDSLGNIYITGTTYGQLPGNTSLGGSGDAFVAKYNAQGTLLWQKQFGSNERDNPNALAIDSEGYIYITGKTNGTLPNNTFLGGYSDAFIAKYNQQGTLIWQKQFGSNYEDYSTAIAKNFQGEIYIAGNTFTGGSPGFLASLSEIYAISLDLATVQEGNSGTTQANFQVTLSNPRSTPITVSYNTTNQTAIAGSDYTPISGVLTFNPQQTVKTLSVSVKGDSLVENNETFFLNLNSSSGGAILGPRKTATGTILDNDNLIGSNVNNRVSVTTTALQANSGSHYPSLSENGRYVAFWSEATNLVSGDTNSKDDIFLYDTLTKTTKLVSKATNGSLSNDKSGAPSISSNGRYIAYFSQGTNLVPGDTNGYRDVFLYDNLGLNTTRISVNSSNIQGNGISSSPSISSDGRYISYWSEATNLVLNDTNAVRDVFLYDVSTKTTTRVSVNKNGSQGNGNSHYPSISADGRYVSYWSSANNLVDGDTNNKDDIFLWDRQTNKTTRISLSNIGLQGNGSSQDQAISGDGKYLVYTSLATNLVPGDTNTKSDIFLYDILNDSTTRISVDSKGLQANGNSSSASISTNGRFVTYQSEATNLITGDTNASADIFAYDILTKKTIRVSQNSSNQPANQLSSYPYISGDGSYVAYESSATNLVANDNNNYPDIFLKNINFNTSSNQLPIDTKGIISSGQSIASPTTVKAFDLDNLALNSPLRLNNLKDNLGLINSDMLAI